MEATSITHHGGGRDAFGLQLNLVTPSPGNRRGGAPEVSFDRDRSAQFHIDDFTGCVGHHRPAVKRIPAADPGITLDDLMV